MPADQPQALQPLPLESLHWRCDPEQLAEAAAALSPDGVIGQDRALEAIGFGLGMARPGYNIFALGPGGTGKHSTVLRTLERQAAQESEPADWCYINNFKQQRNPKAIGLPAARGSALQVDMARFAEELRLSLRGSFESEEYHTRRQVIEEALKERQEQALGEIEQEAKARGVALLRTPMGFTFAPIQDGAIVPPEAFQRLDQGTREAIEAEIQALQKKLQEALKQVPLWMRETREKIRELNDEIASFAVDHLVEALKRSYADLPDVLAYFDDLRQDVIENVEAIVAAPQGPGADGASAESQDGFTLFRKYRVNLIVDNGSLQRAPVVYEEEPTYDRLLGRIEHRAEMGTLLTDFHLIRPGALHRANGGYLVLDARKVLTRPMAWEALKQALHSQQIRIEPLGQALGLLSTVSLEPEPIPLRVKVVLVGERVLYYLLCELDPEFSRLFKVAADFDEQLERDAESVGRYSGLIRSIGEQEKLRRIEPEGIARALEFSARLAGDAERLSARLEPMCDLLREADYWAGADGREAITGADIERAADARDRRLDRVRERILEEIERGTIVIDSAGERVGQVNGLAVMQLGGYAFGRPSRITARVRIGKGEVLDIEREVKLGGPLHSKGVLILGSYLSTRYASERPLSLSASLVFEQSYGGIDGDSASSAELYALLSAIAGIPIKQSLAVTGSVNRHGEGQAIGGVNEKIEGFFDLCVARGLTGEQGVLIPATNVKHLMLHRRVTEAAAQGRFHVYPVETIDQGIALLTGLPAGTRDPSGRFPEGSINFLVEQRLTDLAEKRLAFAQAREDGDKP